jgi:peptide/nickel transport system substrate-binding protein
MKTGKNLCAVVSAAVLLLAGCGSGSSKKGEEAYRDTLNVAYNAQPSTFDPMVTGATATAEIGRLVFESLFEMDSNGDPKPQLCESYTKSDDNKEWTFKLRKGIKFHNGQEMKASDAAASLNRWITKNTIIQRAIKDGEQFTADGDYAVSIKLNNPCLLLPYMIAQYSQFAAILPASVIEAAGNKTLTPDQLIGTGSFKFAEWAVDNYVRLEKFDDYVPFTSEKSGSWGDRTAGVKTIKIYFITDPQTRINGLETGEYDIAASLSYTDIPRLKAMNSTKMITENFNVLTITMNKSKDSIMNNVKWRQIIGYAVNLDEIMEGAIPTVGDYKAYKADASYFGQTSPWYSGMKQNISYDPGKAKVLIKEIGYDGTPLKMMTTEAYPEFYNATLIMKQQLEAVGLKVDLQVMDWGTMLTRLGDTTTFDLYPMNYPFADNPASNMTLMKTNASGFTNDPKLNDLMLQMQALPSFDAAKKFWKETIEPYCSDEVFIINLGSYDYIYGVSGKVEGFKPYYGLALWGVKVAQ